MPIRITTVANVVVAAVVAFALIACGGGGSAPVAATARGELTSVIHAGTVDVAGLGAMVGAVSSRSPVPLTSIPLYPVDFYRVTYRTPDPAGKLVIASGLLLVPAKGVNRASPLLSLQHGTLRLESAAPSYSTGTPAGTFGDAQLGFIAASLGYIVTMPDYLGYGAAKDIFHPYIQAGTLASATIDMIRAGRAFLAQGNIGVNGQLFLAGYSEGGYATLAAQREMETNLSAEFTITASEPGAGPYDLSNAAAAAMGAADLAGVTEPGILAFLLKAYDVYYNDPSRLSEFFTAGTVLTCVNQFFTSAPLYGTDPLLGRFDDCIGGTTVTASILNPAFIDSFNGGGEAVLKAALAQNDIYDWAPQARTRLFYSPADDIVPPSSTINAFNAMLANGAAQLQTAQCLGVAPATHVNCSIPYVIDVLVNFALLANDL